MLIYLQMIENEDDKAKFTQIYTTYRSMMFYVAKRIVGNDADAEDVVHEAFVAIIKNLNKISDINCPKTRSYIVIIVENKAIDHIRKHKHEAGSYDDAIESKEFIADGGNGLLDALKELPLQYQNVLLLRYDNGYSAKEIAVMLGKSHDTVEKMLWRAKRALEKRLDGRGWIK